MPSNDHQLRSGSRQVSTVIMRACVREQSAVRSCAKMRGAACLGGVAGACGWEDVQRLCDTLQIVLVQRRPLQLHHAYRASCAVNAHRNW